MTNRCYVKAPKKTIVQVCYEQKIKPTFWTSSGCIVDFTSIVAYWFFVERLENLGGRAIENEHNDDKKKYT